MDFTTQFHYLSELQPLVLENLLRPVELIRDDLSGDYFAWDAQPSTALAIQPTSSMVLAQQFDQDILGDIVNAWNNFIQSGQVWALIIGIVLGYLIRNLTAY